ncbi:unnamed protein product [Urochloa humidicola]
MGYSPHGPLQDNAGQQRASPARWEPNPTIRRRCSSSSLVKLEPDETSMTPRSSPAMDPPGKALVAWEAPDPAMVVPDLGITSPQERQSTPVASTTEERKGVREEGKEMEAASWGRCTRRCPHRGRTVFRRRAPATAGQRGGGAALGGRGCGAARVAS